eukprot:2752169-Pyramimonas_sp.AAC.1
MQTKIDAIKQEQKQLRPPAVAHRRATQDLYKAQASCERLTKEISEKEDQLARLQESIAEKRLQL